MTTGVAAPPKWYPESVVAPGFIAIGSGPAGLSAAETFRGKHPHIPVRILTADPALPYAKPPLSKDFLCGREVKLELHSPGWFVRKNVELFRGITVDHIDVASQEVVTAGGRLPRRARRDHHHGRRRAVPLQRRFGDDVGERVAS